MRGEDAHLTHTSDLEFQLARADLVLGARIAAQEVEGEKGRMAFVQVIGADGEAEGLQAAQAGDAENCLLLQPIHLVAAIEVIGKASVGLGVLVEIGIEEQHRHGLADRRAEQVQPRPHPDLASLEDDRDLRPERGGVALRRPGIGVLDLLARSRNLLAQIALAADEGDEDRRYAEIGAGARGVPGQNPKPAAIGVHLRPGRDLHGEIGDARAAKKGPDRRRGGQRSGIG